MSEELTKSGKPRKRAPGAGRRRLVPGQDAIRRSTTLLEADWETLEQIGQGNASRGIRELLAAYREQRLSNK
jgi:hypothetical protein